MEKEVVDMTFDEFIERIRSKNIYDDDDYYKYEFWVNQMEKYGLIYITDESCGWGENNSYGVSEIGGDNFEISTIDEDGCTEIKTFVLIINPDYGEVFSGEMVKAKMERLKGKDDDLDRVTVLYKRLRKEMNIYEKLSRNWEMETRGLSKKKRNS